MSDHLSTPSSSALSPSVSADALALAAERRTLHASSGANSPLTPAQVAAQHEKRQRFRRLIDPGITRPNAKERARSSLKTLLTIADNLLRDPTNPKYQMFRTSNTIIKRELIDTKGALEYAVELGFRPTVKDFEPYYVFNEHHLEDLQIGAVILKEHLNLDAEKEERLIRAMKSEKEAKLAAAEKVKLAYMDDRRNKEVRDEMEKQQLIARAHLAAERAARQPNLPPRPRSTSPDTLMPGSGYILGATENQSEEPPAYEDRPKTE
ncbi:Peptide-N(4)-(N-acetyl-beta-glucosaminyl)asparagine amidase [Psilocybe cubensis]|uniref:Peptide-N(4)-(N-acetyl-beta-glucosaminyl)asparagine amidase n=2 Tax=Psilocybe cubensis TaxID=181762 RepID=A0ACB8H489_PSICU|nr:Peptide-N(4)-(N-acetyl-beta-glucosaminyl)asparagine amidase [Psilocybe cubensis]KAH9482691.1 Peptide-N(4)-(N-acetyl-beta-glucosaminyl)asparagine amidase [Psilocybe cubensis]